MTRNYAMTGTGLVLLASVLAWPFAGASTRLGIVLAALVSLPIQIVSYALLDRYRDEVNGFLAAWVGGTLVRLVTLGVVAGGVIWSGHDAGLAMLFALASFFFVLLLLEPVYFRRSRQGTG
jgi:hypothetical protein